MQYFGNWIRHQGERERSIQLDPCRGRNASTSLHVSKHAYLWYCWMVQPCSEVMTDRILQCGLQNDDADGLRDLKGDISLPEVSREGVVEKRITKWTPLPVRHSFPLLHRGNLHCFHKDNMAALTYVSGGCSRHLRKTFKSTSEAPTLIVSVSRAWRQGVDIYG